jgi:hypothetical protein
MGNSPNPHTAAAPSNRARYASMTIDNGLKFLMQFRKKNVAYSISIQVGSLFNYKKIL